MTAGEIIEWVGQAVDVAGVSVIVLGILIASGLFLWRTLNRGKWPQTFSAYREGLGRALLLGLEILVAADIIRTVAVTPTIESVLILAVIVIIRTFLSWSLELELTGRWPWQPRSRNAESVASEEV
ncbi:MAG: DUF1622 domain-containing protein [bacterium]|nr:DUF1622 domain-containing protein [bacterium]